MRDNAAQDSEGSDVAGRSSGTPGQDRESYPRHLADAERTRRYRARRKRGGVLIQFEVVGTALDDLVALGWLPADRRTDKHAVTGALVAVAARALAVRLRRS
jgi:hypothetical protein